MCLTKPCHDDVVEYLCHVEMHVGEKFCGRNSTAAILTPWCRVLLEKVTGSQLLRKFPAFYGTRKFITTLTSARHLSLS